MTDHGLARVLGDVAAERAAQDARWGVQEFPDGTGGDGAAAAADAAKRLVGAAYDAGHLTWRDVLHEEVLEAFAEADPERLRAELIQVAAVAVKWVQALDRRPAKQRFRVIVDVHVLFIRDGRVLLGRRAGTGYGDGMWHLPSGHLEEGESVVEAACREAREEVGVIIESGDLTFAHVMHRAPERVGLFFVAEKWTGEPYNAEPDKCAELGWWPLDQLPADTIDYPAAALRKVAMSEPFALHEWSTDH
ncbi:NUDIX hydrolase [Nonomuraea sediminis]|uniref:NUDIX hydrolase n=1 Tax=Nonomuraea sediminis TaxID=2835864 RepID=UPI001BDD354D|nr:NUDIX domain-containing protein [Nonomuraea sediminis]